VLENPPVLSGKTVADTTTTREFRV